MKKAVCFAVALFLLLSCGCRHLSDNGSSTHESYNHIDDIVSEYEAYIEQELESGNITVSEETSVYESTTQSSSQQATVLEQEPSNTIQSNPPSAPTVGQTTIVIDDSIKKEDAVEVEEADVNTTGSKPLTYTSLTDEQQRIYRILLTAVAEMSADKISLEAVKNDYIEQRHTDIVVAFRSLSADHPEIFWMPQGYASSAQGDIITFVTDAANYYTVEKANLEAMKAKLDKEIQDIVAEASKLSSRFEKELYFHDCLCKKAEYDYSLSSGKMIYTAFGALVDGKAVCEGYSRAMQLLCDKAGIPCALVYGSFNGQGHMWNIIDPGDGWYHLDVTWDDTISKDYQRYAYFNLTEKQIKLEHDIAATVEAGKNYASLDNFNLKAYLSTSEHYNYFIKKKCVFGDDIKQVADIIKSRNNEGLRYAEFLYKNSSSIASAIAQLTSDSSLKGIQIKSYSPTCDSVLLVW